MSDFQAIADRVEIEALRGEFTDAAMMCDYDRVASLFTPDGALRMPDVPVELVGRDQIRAWRERRGGHGGVLRADRPPGHDPARPRHRVRPRLPPRAHWPARRRLTPELRHLPRSLPAHRRRLEIYRTGLRGEVPGHDSAVRYSAPGRGTARWSAGRQQPCGAMTCDAAGHASSRIFPWTVRLARRTCASDARCRGKRSAMRGLNRPAVSWLTITPTASARSCWLARQWPA